MDAFADVRFNSAVYSEGGLTEVINQAGGQLIATSTEGAGVRFYTYGGSSITNGGEITALQWWGVDMAGVASGAAQTVINRGVISGGTGALLGSSIVDEVTNQGVMDGDVSLGAGADIFDGRGGVVNGMVSGGEGDDTYIVDDASLALVENTGEGTDEVQSEVDWTLGDHFETLTLLGGADIDGIGNDLDNGITGNGGDNRLEGRAGEDGISGGAGDDMILGGANSDKLWGGEGDDVLRGGAGADRLRGDEGDDRLVGNRGAGRLFGGDGDDTLLGGTGADQLTGNDGADVFLFLRAAHSTNSAASDRITDFVQGEDLVDLSQLVQGQIVFLGAGGFTGSGQAELRAIDTGGDTRLRIDLDGDGNSDMRIDLTGVVDMTSADFLL
ncbi:MAG TPA: hypothetical protein DEA05_06900 [Rhodobacteraceae bacterium]|nr:hypothetical protein [Paracoccaceae bacterium]